MQIGAIVGSMDVAEVALGTFALFFVGLVRYIQRESNREGFPLRDQNNEPMRSVGLNGIPPVKHYILPHGHHAQAPRPPRHQPVGGVAIGAFPGAPIEPTGNKLTSGLGPSAYAQRADHPDRQFFDGAPRIVPLRADPAFSIAEESDDPRGWTVVGADNVVAGKVVEAWVDRSEGITRYLEVALVPGLGGKRVLVPTVMLVLHDRTETVEVASILGAQFADVPVTKSPDQVTLLEEDKITAYFAGGTLYATPARAEPLV
jgi:photosynthetic reaction center H subunit